MSSRKQSKENSARSPIMRLPEDDELCQQLISFCDFTTVLAVRCTCTRLNEMGYKVLIEQAEQITLAGLPNRCSFWDYKYGSSSQAEANLHEGWTDEISTQEHLIQAAMDCAGPEGPLRSFLEEAHYGTIDLARMESLLHAKGCATIDDFKIDPATGEYYDNGDSHIIAEGWEIRIALDSGLSLGQAWRVAKEMISESHLDFPCEDVDDYGDISLLRKNLLLLLMFADPASFTSSTLLFDFRGTGTKRMGVSRASLMFLTSDHERVELRCDYLFGIRASTWY